MSHISDTTEHWFSGLLASRSIISRFTPAVRNNGSSVCRPSGSPLCGSARFSFTICPERGSQLLLCLGHCVQCCMSVGIQFQLLQRSAQRGTADWKADLLFLFGGTSTQFSIVALSNYTPTSGVQGSPLLHSLTVLSFLSGSSHSKKYELKLWFDFLFLGMPTLFSYISWSSLRLPLRNVYIFSSFALLRIFTFLLWNCLDSILDINFLSHRGLQGSSHSMGSLSTWSTIRFRLRQ